MTTASPKKQRSLACTPTEQAMIRRQARSGGQEAVALCA